MILRNNISKAQFKDSLSKMFKQSNVFILLFMNLSILESKPFRMTFTKNFKNKNKNGTNIDE